MSTAHSVLAEVPRDRFHRCSVHYARRRGGLVSGARETRIVARDHPVGARRVRVLARPVLLVAAAHSVHARGDSPHRPFRGVQTICRKDIDLITAVSNKGYAYYRLDLKDGRTVNISPVLFRIDPPWDHYLRTFARAEM